MGNVYTDTSKNNFNVEHKLELLKIKINSIVNHSSKEYKIKTSNDFL